jgi:hypothetical protein
MEPGAGIALWCGHVAVVVRRGMSAVHTTQWGEQ